MQKNEENFAAVDEKIQVNASRSVKILAVEEGISRESIRSILKKDLSLKPYRIKTLLIKCKAYISLKMLITVMLCDHRSIYRNVGQCNERRYPS